MGGIQGALTLARALGNDAAFTRLLRHLERSLQQALEQGTAN